MNWNPDLMAMPFCKSIFRIEFLARGNGFFLGCKSSNVNVCLPFTTISDPTAKSLSHPSNGTSGIVAFSHVSPVYGLAHFSQIAQAVVQRISVYVINFPVRPAAIGNRKDYPMSLKNYAVDLSFSITGVRNGESLFASICRVKSTIANILPIKTASLSIIAKQFTANFRCDIGSVSHGAVPLRSGQGRRLFAQLFRPVSYARFTLRSQGELA